MLNTNIHTNNCMHNITVFSCSPILGSLCTPLDNLTFRHIYSHDSAKEQTS